MSDMPDDWSLPISALQHYAFCPRQFAIIHIEQYWHESFFTADGRARHERVDLSGAHRGSRCRIEYALPLVSHRHGLNGRADAVEILSPSDDAAPPLIRPIEYKRGRAKPDLRDAVQLCAQAFCLEEMLHTAITDGALFYFATHSRVPVVFDESLRTHTLAVLAGARALLKAGRVPVLEYERQRCAACSLLEYCLPPRKNTSHRTAFAEIFT